MDVFKKTFFVASLVMLSISAFAAPGWGQKTRIRNYYVWDTTTAFIRTDNNENPEGCPSAYYLALDTSAANFNAIWAQVIVAHTTDQTVSLYYDGCLGGYAKVRIIAIPESW